MDAIKFIIGEHNRFRRTFATIKKSLKGNTIAHKKFDILCRDLDRHEKMEQKVWYPNFKEKKLVTKTVKHLISEEKKAAKIIKSFKKIKAPAAWQHKFLKFKETIEHHANEEEKKLFPKVAKILPLSERQQIGKALSKFKRAHKIN